MSITCGEIVSYMNECWPESYAMDWDNVGLLVGSRKDPVDTVYVALDATGDVIRKAKTAGAQLLITHHPLIFGSLKRVNDESSVSGRVLELIKAGICCYASHTCYDIAPGGMADKAAEVFGLFGDNETEPLESTGVSPLGEAVGIGKVGTLKEPVTLRELALRVKEAFSLPAVLVYAKDPEAIIERAAISPGSGKGMAGCALEKGAQVLITGDMGHHDGIDLVEDAVALLDAGHYGLEHIFTEAATEKLKGRFPELRILKEELRWPYEVI